MTKQKTNKVLEGLAKPTWQHPMPTNNQEKWEEEFKDKWLAGDFDNLGECYPNMEIVKSFLRQEIAKAEKRGEKKGVEKTMDEWNNAISNLPAERQEIRQAKIEEQDRILKEIWKRIEWNRKEENQWDGLVIANTRINAFTMAMDIVREPDNQGE